MLNRRRLLVTAAAAALSPGMSLAQAPAKGAAKPPLAPVRPAKETVAGTAVTDPYRWMETEPNPERDGWMSAQGAHTRAVLDRIPGRDALAAANARYAGGVQGTRNPRAAGAALFWEQRPAGAEAYQLAMRPLAGGPTRVLLDPLAGAGGAKRAINYWAPSPDGSLVAFGMSENGSENASIQVVETATGKVLPETIDRCRFGAIFWLPDGRSFTYNRLSGTDPTSVDYYKRSVCWRHTVGTDPASDVKVLAKDLTPRVVMTDVEAPFVFTVPGAETAVAGVFNGVEREITLYSAPAATLGRADAPWTPVCKPTDKVVDSTQRGDELYLLTHADAPLYKLLRTSAARPDLKTAKEVVPASDIVLDYATAAKDGVYLLGRDSRGLGVLRRLKTDGVLETLKLPFEGSLSNAYADPTVDGLWFGLDGWTRPLTVCHVGADGMVRTTDVAPGPSYDVSPYVSEEISAKAADGTEVPLSVVYRRGLKRDGSAPAILEAYGAYGISIDPYFDTRALTWMDAGGVFAYAHVRGGGEKGRPWYEAGKLDTKANTWRDLIACGEALIAGKWTGKGKLAILGTSAGGITVGNALAERPELFAAVISRVGVSNSTRAEFSPNGPGNIPEFGSSVDPKTAKASLAMDAYLKVKDGARYPAVLLTTGLTDPRVIPWQAAKMTARLQAAQSGDAPILLRVEEKGGHGMGSQRSQVDAEFGDIYAFVLWRAGDPRYQPKG